MCRRAEKGSKRRCFSRAFFFATSISIACFCRIGEAQELVSARAQTVLIHNVQVAARDGGIVQKVHVKEGATVTANQELITLDHQLNESEFAIAQREHSIAKLVAGNDIDLRFAAKNTEVSHKVLERSENANSQYGNAITETEIDRLRLEHEKSDLSAEQAQHELSVSKLTEELKSEVASSAKMKLDYRKIVAPRNGLVVEMGAQVGEWLQQGQMAVRIIDLSRMRVVARLDKANVGKIEVGDKAIFVLQRLADPVEVDVVFVSPEIDPQLGNFEIWADFNNRVLNVLPGEIGEFTFETKPNGN